MKLFYKDKDGGPDSTVTGYWLIEWKRLFSIALLCFENGSREVYHNHAFNSISWLLSGRLVEWVRMAGQFTAVYSPSWKPIWTPVNRMHKVSSTGRSWVLTFRGPWQDRWQEFLPNEGRYRTLIDGRQEIETHLTKSRESMVQQRNRSLPVRYYDLNTASSQEVGTWEGRIPS